MVVALLTCVDIISIVKRPLMETSVTNDLSLSSKDYFPFTSLLRRRQAEGGMEGGSKMGKFSPKAREVIRPAHLKESWERCASAEVSVESMSRKIILQQLHYA